MFASLRPTFFPVASAAAAATTPATAPPSLLQRALLAFAAVRYRGAMKMCAPSADRNKEPIADVLSRFCPNTSR